MESVNKSDAYKSKYLNLNTKHQKAEDASGITSVANQSFSNVKNSIESDMNKVSNDVNTQYQVTGGDGDNDTSMSGLEKALAIGTAVASMGATVLGAIKGDSSGGNQNNNNNNAKPLTTSQNLDNLITAYESNKSSKNKAALELGLNKARGELDNVNGQIQTITKENGALEKAANGEFNEVLGQIKEDAKECANTKAAADKKVEICNKDISEITKQKAENGECKINVEKLSDETKTVLGKTEGIVEIKVNQEGKQKGTLEDLQNKFSTYQEAVNTADTVIPGLETAVEEAQGKIGEAEGNLDKAEKMEVTKDGKEDKKLVDARNKAIKDAKNKINVAKKAKEDKEKELKDVQKQREKDHTAMMEVAGSISVGEKTLADIVKEKDDAQQQVAQAKKQIDNYANQLKGYIDANETLKQNADSVQKDKSENENLINILRQQGDDYKNLAINKEKGQATAKAKLSSNQTILTSLQTRQSDLTASIGKAEVALGTPATDNDASTKTEAKTKEKPDAKPEGKTDTPAGNQAVTDGTHTPDKKDDIHVDTNSSEYKQFKDEYLKKYPNANDTDIQKAYAIKIKQDEHKT